IWGILPVRAWMMLAFFIVTEVYSVYDQVRMQGRGGMNHGTSIAYTAHLAGYAYGWAYKASGFRWSRFLRFPFFQNRPRLRIVPPEPRERAWPRGSTSTTLPDPPSSPFSSSARPSTGVVTEEILDAQVDEILAKIAREGRASLTDEEHRILQEASRRAQNRRSERLH
ncbi:MAG TPA: DUF6576 domain-containing protein, partial [Isosphaeraceae bacterium]|nr:DUF6576 domain-containing protein [Isosphaeraceae bacterium]